MKGTAYLTNEITRRQWLLRLGEVGVLAGVSGLVPDILGSVFDDADKALRLPPGLYDPSADAMVHALGNHGLVVPPPGSETEYVVPANDLFQPQFFSRAEFDTVLRIIEILLGKIDQKARSEVAQWADLWFRSAEGVRKAALGLDSMHRALAVAYYGEDDVRQLETLDHAMTAREGFAALHKACVEKYGKNFSGLDITQQAEVLHSIDGLDAKNNLKHFFEALRNEAIRGYYTSAAGVKELDYKGNAYNPQCPGCELSGEKSSG